MTGISDENTCISGVMICGTSGTSRAITSLIADAIAVSVWPMAGAIWPNPVSSGSTICGMTPISCWKIAPTELMTDSNDPMSEGPTSLNAKLRVFLNVSNAGPMPESVFFRFWKSAESCAPKADLSRGVVAMRPPRAATATPTGPPISPREFARPPNASPRIGILVRSGPTPPRPRAPKAAATGAMTPLMPESLPVIPPAPSPSLVSQPVTRSMAGPSTSPMTEPRPLAMSSMGPSALVAAWMRGPSLPNTPSSRFAPIRPMLALRLANAPGTVVPISVATVPAADAAASLKVWKSILPFDAISRTSSVVTPSLSASACQIGSPRSESWLMLSV